MKWYENQHPQQHPRHQSKMVWPSAKLFTMPLFKRPFGNKLFLRFSQLNHSIVFHQCNARNDSVDTHTHSHKSIFIEYYEKLDWFLDST